PLDPPRLTPTSPGSPPSAPAPVALPPPPPHAASSKAHEDAVSRDAAGRSVEHMHGSDAEREGAVIGRAAAIGRPSDAVTTIARRPAPAAGAGAAAADRSQRRRFAVSRRPAAAWPMAPMQHAGALARGSLARTFHPLSTRRIAQRVRAPRVARA